MNARERFLASMNFEPLDRGMLWEFGYWGATIDRWYREGLPRKKGLPRPASAGETICGPGLHWPLESLLRDEDVGSHFGLDAGLVNVPIESGPFPPFEEVVLDEDQETVTMRNRAGATVRKRKDDCSIPQFLDWPIKGWDDFERLKAERFGPALKARFPGDWPELAKEYRRRDYPLVVLPPGCFASLRALMGEARLFTAFYDDPHLVKGILHFLTEFWIRLWSPVLSEVRPDCACIGEDMCYKTGSMVSPAIVREFMGPFYRRMTAFLRESGVELVFVDTDGDCTALIPLFLECGINGLYPMEVQAGMNVVEIRRRFPSLRIWGGLDKRALAGGEGSIEEELATKVPPMMRRGGYIPFADHLVPPDVSWQNFSYYRERLAELVRGAPAGAKVGARADEVEPPR